MVAVTFGDTNALWKIDCRHMPILWATVVSETRSPRVDPEFSTKFPGLSWGMPSAILDEKRLVKAVIDSGVGGIEMRHARRT